jgi:hypothetical protein
MSNKNVCAKLRGQWQHDDHERPPHMVQLACQKAAEPVLRCLCSCVISCAAAPSVRYLAARFCQKLLGAGCNVPAAKDQHCLPSRTGPLTLRMIKRFWSSKNLTRTWVTGKKIQTTAQPENSRSIRRKLGYSNKPGHGSQCGR